MERIQLQIGVTLDEQAVAALVGLIRKAFPEASVEDEKREARLRASEHALLGGQKLPEDKGLLMSNREAAKMLKISEKTIWNMYMSGRMPKPIRIGQRVLWGYEELRAWVNAGCPHAEDWTWPK